MQHFKIFVLPLDSQLTITFTQEQTLIKIGMNEDSQIQIQNRAIAKISELNFSLLKLLVATIIYFLLLARVKCCPTMNYLSLQRNAVFVEEENRCPKNYKIAFPNTNSSAGTVIIVL